jgi:hypothetical protein
VFVHKGTSNYTGGFNLGANERLIGEAANLVVGSDTLHTGDPAKRPTITDTNADVVDLVGIIEVRGLEIDPSGAGGGIAGATGDTGGGTIDDVRIIDTGTMNLVGSAGYSAQQTFTEDASRSRRDRMRHTQAYPRPLAGLGPDLQVPAQQRRSLLHRGEPQPHA